MKIRDLIEALNNFDPDWEAVTLRPEASYDGDGNAYVEIDLEPCWMEPRIKCGSVHVYDPTEDEPANAIKIY